MNNLEERESKRQQATPVRNILGTSIEMKKKNLIGKTIYLTKEQSKRLAFEKAETEKDISEIVREAIDMYFKIKE